jgi:transcription initiation factor TFIIIB Brf1 subunit/transcription initiation factor TFIIB
MSSTPSEKKAEISSSVDSSFDIGPEEICCHRNSMESGGVQICTECGLELNSDINQSPEWKSFSEEDSGQARCSYKRVCQKNIFKELEKFELPREVVNKANDYYFQVVKDQILRASTRKAVIYACVFNAYKDLRQFQIPKELQKKFELNKAEVSTGFKFFNLKRPKSMKTFNISPVEYIPIIMSKFKAANHHTINAVRIYEFVVQRTNLLNASYPQSIAAAICYYYYKYIGLNISYEKFSCFVGMSEVNYMALVKMKILASLFLLETGNTVKLREHP